jgi:hypothetical protein
VTEVPNGIDPPDVCWEKEGEWPWTLGHSQLQRTNTQNALGHLFDETALVRRIQQQIPKGAAYK